MAIGLASAILILLWVQDELSYDRHFKNADNIYRLIEKQITPGGEVSLFSIAPSALTKVLKEEYPEVIRSSRYINPYMILKKGNEYIKEGISLVNSDFLKMFDIEFVKGNINYAFNDPNSIVITEEMAHKYFVNEDPIGKAIQLSNMKFTLTITGVVKSLPHNSHLHFNFLIPVEYLKNFGGHYNEWEMRDHIYIELKNGSDGEVFENKIRDFLKKQNRESNSEIFLQNIKKIHLFSARKYTYDIGGHGDIIYVRIMGLIAVFILLIACVNFMNLATAQSARRAKEIGVRKVAGASKRKIIVQFLGESLLIVFVAHIIAMIIVELLLPGFNNFTSKQLAVNYQSAGLYIGLITIVLFCGLLAGSYPALYLSSLKPLNIMKGVINRNPGNAQFRRVLVIFQFSLSILLIICTLIVGAQLNYIQNKKLGFNKDNIGYFQFPAPPWDPKLETIKKELLKNPNILNVTEVLLNYENPFNIENTSSGYNWAGKRKGNDILFYELSADEDYAKTFQLELKEGRYFSSEFSTENTAAVINEQAAKIMGLTNPIGEIITSPEGTKLHIIGVVKDYHFRSLHFIIEPLIMHLHKDFNLFVKMKPGKISSTVEYIKKTYKSFEPAIPIDFHFLDDDYNKLYRTEQRIGKIFGYFSFLAIIISCLGLIGLSSFMTERRTKEIGIRKANGAKAIEIFSLLSEEYIIWVLISIIIASPIAWYVMDKWLHNFAYRINIGLWVFVFAGVVALFIALLTVSIQSYKAAGKNPLEALRYE